MRWTSLYDITTQITWHRRFRSRLHWSTARIVYMRMARQFVCICHGGHLVVVKIGVREDKYQCLYQASLGHSSHCMNNADSVRSFFSLRVSSEVRWHRVGRFT